MRVNTSDRARGTAWSIAFLLVVGALGWIVEQAVRCDC